MGTSQLLSVPYAIHAKTVENINETDPVFNTSIAKSIGEVDTNRWNTAYNWGNHNNQGYLNAFTEIDPVFNINFNFNTPINNQLLKFNSTNNKWENWTPNFLSTEIDLSIYKDNGSETKINAGTNVTITGNGTTASPYIINSTSSGSGSSSHYIGELYGGGIVFYVDNTGQHGFIMSLTDVASEKYINTSVAFTAIGITAQSDWDYVTANNAITNLMGHTTSAAKKCLDYSYDGFSDWYLPTYTQLVMIANNLYTISKQLETNGFSTLKKDNFYWSCTELYSTPSSKAIAVNIWTSSLTSADKQTAGYVRAIRSF